MKKIEIYGIIIVLAIIFMACSTSQNISNNVTNGQAEIQEYILSQHNQNNNLIYFFINKNRRNENAYAFIITNNISEDDGMQILVEYSMTGNIPGFRVTEASTNWYNKYSPVVIQDDYNGMTMAAFSIPKNVKNIWILVHNVTMNGNHAENKMFPLMDFELSDSSIQYYLINGSTGNINSINGTEMERNLSRATGYGTQLGARTQRGFIIGKGQEPIRAQ